jgi:hypothetical protein
VRAFASREEVVNWIIDNQLGRRNMDPEARSYLRGKRYNREKTAGHGQSVHQNDGQTTAQRLGEQYGVAPATIERDGEFAKAVDILEVARLRGVRPRR